jgi:hypothetical protein
MCLLSQITARTSIFGFGVLADSADGGHIRKITETGDGLALCVNLITFGEHLIVAKSVESCSASFICFLQEPIHSPLVSA